LGELADRTNLDASLWSIPAAGAIFVLVVAAWGLHDRMTGLDTVSGTRR
jgi:hypothetical protein